MIVVVIVIMPAISPSFRLERSLHPHKMRSQGNEHVLDHMIGPNAKDIACNFSGQMTISQMPSKTRNLTGVFVPDFDDELGSGLNLQQSPILELQAISVGHRNRFWKVEKDVLTLIRGQANAPAVTRIKIESDCACRLLLRPMPGATTYRG